MGRVDGGELFIRVLEAAGVDTLFTLHGGHLDAIFQAAHTHGLRLVDTRHEQAAGHAADGWARSTGRVGVAVVTAGPGFTDCVTAITNAYLDCVPTLFVAGAAPLRDAETLPLQGGIDQVAMVAPVTKWSHRITHTERIPDLVAQAIRIATSGRPGPVFLELPIDVLFRQVEESRTAMPASIAPEVAPAPPPEAVARLVEWLAEAERPAILAGGGVWFSGGSSAVAELAELTRTPVFTNSKARGVLPAAHELNGGGFASLGVLTAQRETASDLVLVLGARLGLFTGGRGTPILPAGARVVQIDIAAEEIGRNRDIDLGIAADCRQTATALAAAARDRDWPRRDAWLAAVQATRDGHHTAFAKALETGRRPIHPYRLAREVAQALPPGTIVAADGGETASWMDMVAQVHGPGEWMSHGYLGCLGTGMPFAIAAQVAHPDRRVLCVVGDGSVGLNFAEFDTMARHRLPIVTVVANDQLWGMSAHGQDLIYGRERRVVTELAPTRYDLAAAGFGCHAEYVEDPEELPDALHRAFTSGKPACVNAMVDGTVIAPVTLALVGAAASTGEGEAASEATGGGKDSVTLPYYDDLEG